MSDVAASGKLFLLVNQPDSSDDPGQTAGALDESHRDA